MMTAATMPRDLANEYSRECRDMADKESDPQRRNELLQMAENLLHVPWEPAENFWEAIQSLWLTHMLVMADENYPGPGDSFGRLDQYLYPSWEKTIRDGMDRNLAKNPEMFLAALQHCIRWDDSHGRQPGITAGYGQLFTISGMERVGWICQMN